jgi:hypothetical protein
MGTYITGGMMPSWIHSLPPMYGASGRLILWRFDQMQKVLAAVEKIQQCIIH